MLLLPASRMVDVRKMSDASVRCPGCGTFAQPGARFCTAGGAAFWGAMTASKALPEVAADTGYGRFKSSREIALARQLVHFSLQGTYLGGS